MILCIVILVAYTMSKSSKSSNILEKMFFFPYTNGRGKFITRNPLKEDIPTGFYLYPNPTRSIFFSETKSGVTISTVEYLSKMLDKESAFETMIQTPCGAQEFYYSNNKKTIKKLHKKLEQDFGGKVLRIRGRRSLSRNHL